jgi:membrane protease YdiL (CAAX protease family)
MSIAESPPPEPSPLRSDPAPRLAARPGASRRQLLLMLGLIGGWFLLMRHLGGSIYSVMGPFAVTVSVVIAALANRELRRWLKPTRTGVITGLCVGVGMTLATYPVYSLAKQVFPALGGYVAQLYLAAQETTWPRALPWVLAIIVAEELLWRGALLYVLSRRVPPNTAMAISVATYALAQFGTGSFIVMLLALVCGSIWTLQRHLTGSLLSPLLSHLIWTPVVILLYPVTSL